MMDEGTVREIATPEEANADNAADKFMMQIPFAMAKKSTDDTSQFVRRDVVSKMTRVRFRRSPDDRNGRPGERLGASLGRFLQAAAICRTPMHYRGRSGCGSGSDATRRFSSGLQRGSGRCIVGD
jgi:hypothetical protein